MILQELTLGCSSKLARLESLELVPKVSWQLVGIMFIIVIIDTCCLVSLLDHAKSHLFVDFLARLNDI